MNDLSIIAPVTDPALFALIFGDIKTWGAWLIFLKAIRGEKLTRAELGLWRECTGRRRPPVKGYREAWVACGRRAGKSFIAAYVAVYFACFLDWRRYLKPGERPQILILAADRPQARNIWRFLQGFLSVPMLRPLVETERAESIDLTNQVSIEIATCSYRSIRGRGCILVIADEMAFWRDADSQNPAGEVLRAIRPSLLTFPGSFLLCLSTFWSRQGTFYENVNENFGKDDSDRLSWIAGTSVMNPCIPRAEIERELALDPEAGAAEWLAVPRSDLETFLDAAALQACVVQGRYELPPRLASNLGLVYQAGCDSSGGKIDAAGLAIAHREGEVVVVDLARRWPAPHVPAAVVAEQAEILKSYGISMVCGDKYAGSWPSDEFSKHGIRYEPSDRDKSRIYLDFLPLVMSGNVELLDNKTLINELRGLERRTRSAGRDLVDHSPRCHDDLANAVAVACTLAGRPRRIAGPAFFRGRGRPEPEPKAPLHPRLQYKTQAEIPCGADTKQITVKEV